MNSRSRTILAIIIIHAFVLSFFGQWILTRRTENGMIMYEPLDQTARIISLSPSVTETLFELGLGKNVIGVTFFCNYPEEAKEIYRVGDYHSPNYEAILRLKPDLVILREEQGEVRKTLERLGIRCLTVNHNAIEGIIESFIKIGNVCGAGNKASEIVSSMKERMDAIAEASKSVAQQKVLIIVERDFGKGSITDAIAVGSDGFYSKMLEMAGGIPAFGNIGLAFPRISAESIISVNPDIIIETVPNLMEMGLTEEKIISDWNNMRGITAISEGRIYVTAEDFMVIPGPRFILILEELARIIHPDEEKEKTE